ncbi:MAG: DnaD domain protein [Anaerorhabdus sp.]
MLDINDEYRTLFVDSLPKLEVLSLLYTPIIGKNASILYLTLFSNSKNNVHKTHNYLSSLLNLDVNELDEAFKKCEEYHLIKKYIKTEGSKTIYVYQLLPLLSSINFFNHRLYCRLLFKNIGIDAYNYLKSTMCEVIDDKYSDITRVLDSNKLDVWSYSDDIEFSKLKKEINFTSDENIINFDYKKLLNGMTELQFPVCLRTEENLKIIGQYANIYGINEDNIKRIVIDSINLSTCEFNLKRFKLKCELFKPNIENKSTDPYAMSPIAFLQTKQKGMEVQIRDKKVIFDVVDKTKFSNEVINTLIEYVLDNSDNALYKSYMMTIASQWYRSKVETRDDALNLIKSNPFSFSKKNNKVELIPEYLKNPKKYEERKLTKEGEKELMDLINSVKF